jgi:hypothetical protein
VICAASAVAHAQGSAAASAVIYKHVDENGRVTYTNAPVRGATIVELAPLTVIPGGSSAPAPVAAAARQANAPTTATILTPNSAAPVPSFVDRPVDRTKLLPQSGAPEASGLAASTGTAPETTPVSARASTDDATATPSIKVLPLPTGLASASAPSSPPVAKVTTTRATPPSVAAGLSAAALAKQRRENVRKRILEGEIEAESELLADARDALQREQKKSQAMRALRDVLIANDKSGQPRTPESSDNATTRGLVERHFERVRDLQDQVAMHEQNLSELRAQLKVPPMTATSPSSASAGGIKPVSVARSASP